MATYQWTIGEAGPLFDGPTYGYGREGVGGLSPDTLEGVDIQFLLTLVKDGIPGIMLGVRTFQFQNTYITLDYTANGNARSIRAEFGLIEGAGDFGLFFASSLPPEVYTDLQAELGNTIELTLDGPLPITESIKMGFQVTVGSDAASKSQYLIIPEVDGDAIAVADGEFVGYMGIECIRRRMMGCNGLNLCKQKLRELGWPDPTAGLVNWVSYDILSGQLLSGLNEPVPILAATQVGLFQGSGFTVSHDSNSAHATRIAELYRDAPSEQIGEPPFTLQPGLNIAFALGFLNLGNVNVEFPAGVMAADIDWGDGSPVESVTAGGTYGHAYTGETGEVFVINVQGTITGIDLSTTANSTPTTNTTLISWGGTDCAIVGPGPVLVEDSVNYFAAPDDFIQLNAPTNMSNHVRGATNDNMPSLVYDYSQLDWSQVNNQSLMFNVGFGGITAEFDISNIDFGAMTITSSTNMFANANISGLSTSAYNFASGNLVLQSLFSTATFKGGADLSGWVTDATVNMSGMFSNVTCEGDLDLSGWVFGTSRSSQFQICRVEGDWHLDGIALLNLNEQALSQMVVTGEVTLNGTTVELFNGSFGGSWGTLNLSGATWQADLIIGASNIIVGDCNFDTSDLIIEATSAGSLTEFSNATFTTAPPRFSILRSAGDFDITAVPYAQLTQLSFQGTTGAVTFPAGFALTLHTTFSGMFRDTAQISLDFSDWDFNVALATGTSTLFNFTFSNAAGMTSSDVDSFLERLYAARLSIGVAYTLDLTTTAALTGTYQDSATPSTGLEYAYKLIENPDAEAFTPMTITGPGLP